MDDSLSHIQEPRGGSADVSRQTVSAWDALRDGIDINRRWISSALYLLFIFLCIVVKRSSSDYRINRIRGIANIPFKVIQKRKKLIGFVVAVDAEGYIEVLHIPLLHLLNPFLPRRPLFSKPSDPDCIRLRLDAVSLLQAASADADAASEGGARERDAAQREGEAGSPATLLRALLLHKRVCFIPVEADVAFLRAHIRIRGAGESLPSQDVGELLLARGLAAVDANSFSLRRPANAAPFYRPFQTRMAYKRLLQLERTAASQNVGLWSRPQLQQQQQQQQQEEGVGFFKSTVKSAFRSCRSLLRRLSLLR
ncbi:hypothetical protein Efla_006783 [Eimeria flavescens]